MIASSTVDTSSSFEFYSKFGRYLNSLLALVSGWFDLISIIKQHKEELKEPHVLRYNGVVLHIFTNVT